jgi:hypothetical protein
VIELLLALALLGGATGVGHTVLHLIGVPRPDRTETAVFSLALGLGTLILLTMALGLVGGLYRPVLWIVVAMWSVVGWRKLWLRGVTYAGGLRAPHLDPRSPYVWLVGILGLTMLLHVIRALVPPHGATDPLAYQLALPRLYLIEHQLSFEPTLTGALYPANMALLYLVSLALRNGILAQLLHLSLAGAICVGIFAAGRRYLSWQAGVFGAVVFSSMPVIIIFAPQGYVDIGLCFFQFTALWAVANWARSPDRRALLLAALLTGLAAGVKHQGLATILVGVGVLAIRRLAVDRDVRGALIDVALFVGIALVLICPWYARAYFHAGNPVWPLANGIFHGLPYGNQPLITSGGEGGAAGSWWHAVIPPASWFQSYARSMNPWYWTFEPAGWQKAIGVYFIALLPGVLLSIRRPVVWQLTLFCLGYYVILVRVLHMNPRYGLVLFAAASLLCGFVAHRLASSSWRPIRVLFVGAVLLTVLFNLTWSYSLARPYLSVAVGGEAREVFLARTEANYRLFRFINENTPEDSRILLQGIVKGYYCERDYLWDHPQQSVVRYEDVSVDELFRRLQGLGVSHVARMIRIPATRVGLGYPQYFTDEFQEQFRAQHLRLIYRDESFVLFELHEGGT